MSARIEKSFKIQAGEYGTRVIVQYGRCSHDLVGAILNGCSEGVLEPIPHARGAVFKPMDGTNPIIFSVKPSTGEVTFKCVKRSATANPMAPVQQGGAFDTSAVWTYEMVFQEVGSLTL